MGWALTLVGRVDRAGILMLVEDRDEAESLAHEIRRNGTQIVVRPYPSAGSVPSFPAQTTGPAPRPAGEGR